MDGREGIQEMKQWRASCLFVMGDSCGRLNEKGKKQVKGEMLKYRDSG